MNESAEIKLAKQRLSALQLAEALGNVSEACRRRGISRTQFYEYKRRFQTHGLEGLKDLPPIHKSHPQTTPPEIVEKILELSLANPMWGCIRLSGPLGRSPLHVLIPQCLQYPGRCYIPPGPLESLQSPRPPAQRWSF